MIRIRARRRWPSTVPGILFSSPTLVHVCEALAFMHDLGYAHRDIKSENVLVEHDQRPDGTYLVRGVKVIDLGLACAINDDLTRGESCGSRGFMAPEVNSRGAYWYQFHYSR